MKGNTVDLSFFKKYGGWVAPKYPESSFGINFGETIKQIPVQGSVSLIGKAVVLKITSNHLRRGVSVRVWPLPQCLGRIPKLVKGTVC